MSGGGLCGACQRQIPVRGDGKLRAHLAVGSAAGRRQQCDGSTSYPARIEAGDAPVMSRAEAFNAREAWFAVAALYDDWQSMAAAGGASIRALYKARDAYLRARADARALADWWDVQAYEEEEDAA